MTARRAAFAALACAALASPSLAENVVTVEALYLERIATPPGAVLVAMLEDVARADAPARELARTTIEDAGDPPWRLKISYAPEAVDPAGRYAVRVTLRVAGQLWFTSTAHHGVLTQGAGDHAEIVLSRVAAPDAAAPLTGTRWTLTALDSGAAAVAAPGHVAFGDDGRLGGDGGCNTFGGGYIARPDGAFLAGTLFSTMMACEDARMTQERAVFDAFGAARGWRIEGAALTLSDAQGASVATFAAAAP